MGEVYFGDEYSGGDRMARKALDKLKCELMMFAMAMTS